MTSITRRHSRQTSPSTRTRTIYETQPPGALRAKMATLLQGHRRALGVLAHEGALDRPAYVLPAAATRLPSWFDGTGRRRCASPATWDAGNAGADTVLREDADLPGNSPGSSGRGSERATRRRLKLHVAAGRRCVGRLFGIVTPAMTTVASDRRILSAIRVQVDNELRRACSLAARSTHP